MNTDEYNGDEMEIDSIEMQDGEPHQTLMFDIKDGKVEPVFELFEDSIASDVYRITECVQKLIHSKQVLFELVKEQFSAAKRPNTLSVKAGPLGNTLLRCLRLDLDRVIDKYPDIEKYNRYFGIYYDAVTRDIDFGDECVPFATVAKEEWLNYQNRNCWADTTLKLFIERSNAIVEEIRRAGRNERFSQWKRAVERQSKDNFETLWSLVLACLNVNHHALVLRFDLGYPQFYRDAELSGVQAVTYEDVRRHRVALRLFLKCELKKRLPAGACRGMGFGIKLEYGLDKECHFHVIAILNGDIVREDVTIVDMIGDYWQTVITRGKGGLYNCNKAKYVSCGIGSLRYDNAKKLKILETVVVPYLVKPDFYMKMVKPESHRCFWVSQPPKIEAKRRGRKRGKTAVAPPLLKATPVADFEACLARFSTSTGEHKPSHLTDSGAQQNQSVVVTRSMDIAEHGDIPWDVCSRVETGRIG